MKLQHGMILLGGLLIAIAGLTSPPELAAAPAPDDCDNLCRERTVMFNGSDGYYYEWDIATCYACTRSGALCKPDAVKDKITGGNCWVPAGGENMNEFRVVASLTVCNHPGTVYVEASTKTSATGDVWWWCDVMQCIKKKTPVATPTNE